MLKILPFLMGSLLIDFYAYQSIQVFTSNLWIKILFLGFNFCIHFLLFYIYLIDRELFSTSVSNSIVGIFLLLTLSKLIWIGFLFAEDLYRLTSYLFQGISQQEKAHLPSRRKFVSQVALLAAAIPFTGLLYGIFKGKYNFKVWKYTLYFEDLPDSFDGYQLTQLSDLHCGSFDDPKKISYGIDLVNQQNSDLILLTGDLVNAKASELLPWKSTLKKMKAKDGIYSVMGNHDYGDYVKWNSPQEKKENFKQLKKIQKEMGFQLLLNESDFIYRNNERLSIVGVENWGKGFVQKGDLKLASQNVKPHDFSIVLSHDPTHWEEEIVKSSQHFHLTLSGHTHGMQFGIEIPGWIKWSPIKWRYKRWAGIYEKAGKYININRGFGFLAFPGRTGIWPEITVITLKKKR